MESGSAHHLGTPAGSEVEELFRQAAVSFLAAIGIGGKPPDPAQEFGELDSDKLNAAWLSGAIHPITLRGLAGLLIAALPKETVEDVGLLLVKASVPLTAKAESRLRSRPSLI